MIAFLLLISGLAIQAMGETKCIPSAKIQMSREFLPAAIEAGKPIGFGTCNKSNNTCLTPPASCPESSCCLKGIRDDSCGCADEVGDLGPEWGGTLCSDPKALRFAFDACDAGGTRHSTELQLYASPAYQNCQERATVQVVESEGRTQLRVEFSACKTLPENLKGNRGTSQCSRGGGSNCDHHDHDIYGILLLVFGIH